MLDFAAANPEKCQDCPASTFDGAAKFSRQILRISHLPPQLIIDCTLIIFSDIGYQSRHTHVIFSPNGLKPAIKRIKAKSTWVIKFCDVDNMASKLISLCSAARKEEDRRNIFESSPSNLTIKCEKKEPSRRIIIIKNKETVRNVDMSNRFCIRHVHTSIGSD